MNYVCIQMQKNAQTHHRLINFKTVKRKIIIPANWTHLSRIYQVYHYSIRSVN